MILTKQYLTHRQYVRQHNISLMQLHEFNHKLLCSLLPAMSDEVNVYQSTLGACPRTGNLLQNSWIWPVSPLIFVKYTYIRLKLVKKLTQTNYFSLRLLFSDKLLANKPTLQVTIRERFKFTTEFSMCMLFDAAVSDALVIRVYHDAQLAELIYSNEFEKQYRQMGGKVDSKNQANLRYSQNCFLNKWLIYLLENHFNSSTWKNTSPHIS